MKKLLLLSVIGLLATSGLVVRLEGSKEAKEWRKERRDEKKKEKAALKHDSDQQLAEDKAQIKADKKLKGPARRAALKKDREVKRKHKDEADKAMDELKHDATRLGDIQKSIKQVQDPAAQEAMNKMVIYMKQLRNAVIGAYFVPII